MISLFFPRPPDNSSDSVRDHLMEELDYFLLPESAWAKLVSWYQLSQKSRPLARKVVEHGMYMKHCKVEVYLLEFKLSLHPNLNNSKTRSFSRADTVGDLEAALKEEYDIAKAAECRVWHRFMTHTYELLSNSSQSLQDAGLYNGQVSHCCVVCVHVYHGIAHVLRCVLFIVVYYILIVWYVFQCT